MSAISREEVAHLAMLARIDLQPHELDRMAGQLDVILQSVATVSDVVADAGDIPATSHPLPLVNVTRPDRPRPSLPAELVLDGAPEAEEQRFRVPRILEED
jgi:aspartyl-tRNA(Asn)/glutamyl-tRNA(Gln) amidotransferase subunit C